MKTKKLLILFPITAMLLSGCLPAKKGSSSNSNSGQPAENDPDDPADVEPAQPITDVDPADPADPTNVETYYANIGNDLTGSALKNALYSLIHPNKCKTAYGAVWDYLIYADAGHPEDTSISPEDDVTAFYQGTVGKKSTMNKEHVWPNSRGGNYVEGDPHMTRPTFTKDNSNRGNSFYVEGMCDTAKGWDPKAANMNETYRGDSARIILYAAVQEKDKLSLVDLTNDSTDSHTMGKLSDLLKWNIEYPVQQREMNRNDILSGAMTSHGKKFNFNRNPFIDHPEYACRIWGMTNNTTKAICGM